MIHTRPLPLTNLQLLQWSEGQDLAQVAPELTLDDRRFLLTGVTPEEEGAT